MHLTLKPTNVVSPAMPKVLANINQNITQNMPADIVFDSTPKRYFGGGFVQQIVSRVSMVLIPKIDFIEGKPTEETGDLLSEFCIWKTNHIVMECCIAISVAKIQLKQLEKNETEVTSKGSLDRNESSKEILIADGVLLCVDEFLNGNYPPIIENFHKKSKFDVGQVLDRLAINKSKLNWFYK